MGYNIRAFEGFFIVSLLNFWRADVKTFSGFRFLFVGKRG